MRPRRLLVPPHLLASGPLLLPEDLAHYVRDVLRLRAGSPLQIADGAGRRALGAVTRSDRGGVMIEVLSVEVLDVPATPRVTVLQGIGKGEKMDLVVRMCAELGVARVVPVHGARTVPRGDRLARWRAIARDASRVSGSPESMEVADPMPLAAALGSPRAGLSLCLAPGAEEGLRAALVGAPPSGMELLVGPEGGFTEDEIAGAAAAGFRAVHLGEQVLRTETAGPIGAALLLYWGGALGG